MNSIGVLLPMALCGRSSLYSRHKPLVIDRDVLEKLKYPQETLAASLMVRMDDGSRRSFKAWRCRYDDTRGPTKGGIRYHPKVNIDEVMTLGRSDVRTLAFPPDTGKTPEAGIAGDLFVMVFSMLDYKQYREVSLDVELSGGFFESLMYILLAILGGAMGVFMFPPWSYLFYASIAALIVCAFTKKADGEETD